ncbi:molybdopterin molybdotransferase MoeA [Halosimplex amylolyticum]|uniref:molybdopterin molybdotransferase MoeA n=1 Tax=Halosimplex amylolyticum TaxID=3396616 RepID=UPI003F555DC1
MTEPPRSAADRTATSTARDRLRAVVAPTDRTETLPVSTAVSRPLAEPVVARRAVPAFDQAARDGFAVRAPDTADASAEAPVELAVATVSTDAADAVPAAAVEPGTAVPVEAGAQLPEGADAVAGPEAVHGVADPDTTDDALTVSRPVDPEVGVRRVGADVVADETVRPSGHRLRPSDPALCTAVGRTRVEVVQRPAVGIVPTGGAVTSGDPRPGESVETNGTTVAEFAERFGAKVTYRDPVEPAPHALRAAVERDLTKDLLVTVGGTGPGESDRIRDVVADLGEVEVDGVALEPGGTTALSVVRERPVLSIPGDPVAAFVATTQFVAPAVARLAGREPPAPVTVDADLATDVVSESGLTSVVPVAFEDDDESGAETERTARLVADEPLSTLARADGWVVVPTDRERVPAGETVSVERWEASV